SLAPHLIVSAALTVRGRAIGSEDFPRNWRPTLADTRPMTPLLHPLPALSSPRIPLHSARARPLAWTFTSVYALGVGGLATSVLREQEALHPLALLAISVCLGMLIWKMWDLCRCVYMTREGIEVTRPRRVFPWHRIGNAFHEGLTRSWPPICHISINEALDHEWDLQFFGRSDFESVVSRFRADHEALTPVTRRTGAR
ncbi:MAG TPA: hypothetical protein VEQ59_06155, partial [Polyangiaceae bacterium]|nr:hypothetical protein [Polyangiaceae bacterium]